MLCLIDYFLNLIFKVNIPQHLSSIKIVSMLVSVMIHMLAFPKRFQIIIVKSRRELWKVR